MHLFRRFFNKKKLAKVDSAAHAKRQENRIDVDWNNEVYLNLLSRFLKPKDIVNSVPDHWESLLGESPQVSLNRCIENGLIVSAPLNAKVEYSNTAASLKKMLKERSLQVSGNKHELVDRLMAADEEGMLKLYGSKMIFQCSAEARVKVSNYINNQKSKLDGVIAILLTALSSRDFEKASLTIQDYESKKLDFSLPNPFALKVPPRMTSADIQELKMIFTLRPKILGELSEIEWEILHVVTSISHLLHGEMSPKWVPSNFQWKSKFDILTTVRMMRFHIIYINQIKKMEACGIEQGRILGCGASCEECLKIENRIDLLHDLPELPYESCTNEMGCRCTIIPI
ncbi:MAG: SAP domain-containing protein [Gammaproteobacteria bacterium]